MVKVIEPPYRKKNWVVFDKSTKRYLGRVIKPETQNYPIVGECTTKWGWVNDIQEAKSDWILRPSLFLIKVASGFDMGYCDIQPVLVDGDGIVTVGE